MGMNQGRRHGRGYRSTVTRFCRSISVCLVLLLFPADEGWSEKGNPDPAVIRVGYSTQLLPDLDERDARVAIEVWSKELNRSMGTAYRPKAVLYRDLTAITEALTRGEIDLISMTALEYLKIRDRVPAEPAIIPLYRTEKEGEMVLIVHRDSGITSAQQLKNRKVLVQSGHRGDIAVMWMDILLMRKGQPQADQFCSLRRVNKASQAVLPVFFMQADAAVVSRQALDTVAELNPQISREIAEIGSSKPVVHSVSCFRKNIEINMRNALYKAAVDLDKDAYGRQVLMMFQLKRLGEYEPKYLDYLSSLVTDHSNLKKKFTGKR